MCLLAVLSAAGCGLQYMLVGQYDLAIADCTKAIELKPDFAQGYNNRGFAYGKKGDCDRAMADFAKAVEIKPESARASYNRGYVHAKRGEHGCAMEDLERAAILNPRGRIGRLAKRKLRRLEKRKPAAGGTALALAMPSEEYRPRQASPASALTDPRSGRSDSVRSDVPREASRVCPVLASCGVFDFYGGHVDSTFGVDLVGGIGVDLSAGVRLSDRFGLALGFDLSSPFARDEGADLVTGVWWLTQLWLRGDVLLPLGNPELEEGNITKREISVSVSYIPSATLLDRNGDGWRDGSGIGIEIGFHFHMKERKSPAGHVYRFGERTFQRYALGYRGITFEEFQESGSSSPASDSLGALYFCGGTEYRF